MFIIKLGGSVITDKTKKQTFKQTTTDRLSMEIKKANKEIIIVHGAGSFGHIPAKEYKIDEGYKDLNQIKGFSVTHEMVQTLNSLVLRSLHEHGIPGVSISPHSTVKLDNHEIAKMDFQVFKEYLEKKFVPVTFGDVVLDKKIGFSICSGDLLMDALAGYFKPEKAVFVIDEDGLYTSNPKIDENAEFIESTTLDKLEKLTVQDDKHVDVTGGMAGKIKAIKNILNHGVDVVLVNGNKPGRLYNVLVGEDTVCTILYGR
ncbi:MAG: kinase [Thermoplasmata archaeon]|nr:MAG: kinase [Thermoplasmata archaeon]RLF53411.1 MAG: kinase [Thermoplasmata archaeon]